MNADDDPAKAFRLFLPYGVSLSMGAENWPPLVSETADQEPVCYALDSALHAVGTLSDWTACEPCTGSVIITGASMSMGAENWPPLLFGEASKAADEPSAAVADGP